MLLRWQHKLFLTSFPSQEQPIQEQNITEKILEHRSETEAPPCTSETKMNCIRTVEIHYMLIALPFSRIMQHHVKRSPMSLCFFQWKK